MIVPIVITSERKDLDRRVEAFLYTSGQPIVHHVAEMEWFSPDEEVNRLKNIAKGRNAAWTMAKKLPTEWFFFLDADVVPPKGTIETLLNAQQVMLGARKAVVGGWIPARHSDWIGGLWQGMGVFKLFKDIQPGFSETHLLSLGCTLVNRKYIEDYVFDPGISLCQNEHGSLFHLADSGEFSRVMRNKHSLDLLLDSRVVCEHLCRK